MTWLLTVDAGIFLNLDISARVSSFASLSSSIFLPVNLLFLAILEGEKKLKDTQRRGRVNVMRALRYTDKKRLCFMINKGDANTFYDKLEKFHQALLQEWIEKGNNAELFRELGQKIIIIIDNASYHKKQEIISKIEEEFPNIKLEYLPPYSPDYNLIELVWHSAKEYIAHREFENKDELEKIVNQLLNEEKLTIKWSKKRKNKGNAINVT